jgi:DNA-3-methyladenine glycosylase
MTALLPRDFFARDALVVAPALLGKLLVREVDGMRLTGRIVEVEAYLGAEDAASHAYRGRTPRNASMFGPPGHAYVYLIYGIHHCLNVVTGPAGQAQAVLIRAIQPIEGLAAMRMMRGRATMRHLTDGPGKLCQALRIDRSHDGHDLCLGQALWLEDAPTPNAPILSSPRIGIRGDELALARAWRYAIAS